MDMTHCTYKLSHVHTMDALQESSVTLNDHVHNHNHCHQQDPKKLFCSSLLAELHDNVIAPICWPFQHTGLFSSSAHRLNLGQNLNCRMKRSANHSTDIMRTNFQVFSLSVKHQNCTYTMLFLHAVAWRLLEVITKYLSCERISCTRSFITTPSLYNSTVLCLRGQRWIYMWQMNSLVTPN